MYLCEHAHVGQGALCVRNAHHADHPVDVAETPRVIPAILRAWECVNVQVDADAVLARPAKSLEDVANRRPRICQ